MNNLKANVIQYYIINNFIRVLSLLLKDNNISQESKDYIINSLYEVYLSSSSANKNKLIDLYLKYELISLFKKALFDNDISYAKIDYINNVIKSSGNDNIKDWFNDNFLNSALLYTENNFISDHTTQAAYIFLNTDISELDELEDVESVSDITNDSFIKLLVSNYTPSYHEEWLNYIINNITSLTMSLWRNGISFSDDQLKSIDNLHISVSNDNAIVGVIKLNFINYVRSECDNIIRDLHSNNKLGSPEYSVLDILGSLHFFDLLSDYYSHVTNANYNSSLLKKINDYSLVNLFEYLFNSDDSDKYISLSDQDYLLGRSDCSTDIKVKLLSHYTLSSLNDIDSDTYPNLYNAIFNFSIYDPFIKGIRGEEDGFDTDKLRINSNVYRTSIAAIAPEEDLYDIIEYSVNSRHKLTSLFNCLVSNRFSGMSRDLLNRLDSELASDMSKCVTESLEKLADIAIENKMYNTLCYLLYNSYTSFDSNYILFTSLNAVRFRETLVNTLDTFEKSDFKRKSYKLLNYGDKLIEEFLYLVLNKLSNDDCYDFCFTDDLSGNYSHFRDYLCNKFDTDNDNYGFSCYFKNIPWDITSKWDSEQFGKIAQDAYRAYESYVAAYDNNISVLSYYDPNNLGSVHPNRRIIENANVLWNIIIYLAFNKANSSKYTIESLRKVENCLYHMLRPNDDLINDLHSSLYSTNNINALYNQYIITAISSTVNRCSKINGLLNAMLDKHDNSLYWKVSSIEDNVESFLLFVYYNKSHLANVIGSTCNRIISLVNSCYYYNYDFYYSILNHCIDFYDLSQYKGVQDKIAYASLKYVSQLQWNTLASANCYAALAYKLINYESGSYIPHDVKQYIQNNWKKLMPYLTEGYTKILVSSGVNRTEIVEIVDYTQNSISELLSNYNPWSGALADTGAQLSECYIRLAKYYIIEAIPDISFNNSYKVIYTPYNGTLLPDYEVTCAFRLSQEPTAAVTLTFTANNNAIDMDKTTLTFTQSNWSTSQDITFKLNDSSSVVDSSVEVIAHVSSNDTNYNNIEFTPFISAIESNSAAGIICSSNSISITESGSSTVNFKLVSKPNNNVVLSFTSASSRIILPSSISFSQLNWNTPQQVTFSVNNNNTVDGNVTADVVIASSSSDQLYNGLSNTLHVTIIDGNTADIDCGSPTISLSSSTPVTRLIKLTSQPTRTVTINISSSNDSVVISHSQISLTQSNWNIGVQVTFSVANNANSQTAEILLSASSQDTNYNNLSKHITATVLSESIGVTAFTTSTFAINTDISAIIEADQGIIVDFPQIYNHF